MSFVRFTPILRRARWTASVAFITLALIPSISIAQTTIDLVPIRDNTLYEHALGGVSNGAGSNCFAGLTNHFTILRAVFAFDLSSIPAGSTVLSVEFRLTMDRSAGFSGPQPMTLHRLAASWGEGTSAHTDSLSGGGGGVPATTDDATWLHRFYPSTFWAQPGGDFDPAVLATTMVSDVLGVYQWGSTPEMQAVVQSWIDDPSSNFGWMLRGNEAVELSARRFVTREGASGASRPHLIVTYGVVAATEVPPVRGLRFHSPVPNPFNPSTTFRWDTEVAGVTRISVWDARGSVVARLPETLRSAGPQSLAWQAHDPSGRPLPSGVYLVRLEHAGELRSRRVVLVR